MEDLIKTIQTFLMYSDDKLEELTEKNKALKLTQYYHDSRQKKGD